jgi:hypothetical protein
MRLRQGLEQSLTGKSKGCKNAAEEMSVSIIIEVYSVSVEVPTREFVGEFFFHRVGPPGKKFLDPQLAKIVIWSTYLIS